MTGWSLDGDLHDRVAAGEPAHSRVWVPDGVAVVLGRGDDPGREVDLAACAADGVPVLRRRGGGGAVVLGPGCVVVSVAWRVGRSLAVGEHLRTGVRLLSVRLEEAVGLPLTPRGSGDLCVGDRKAAGSSAFCGRGVFLYQASVLVEMDLALVERYLRHPSREPAYRGGRPHREFLINLREAGAAVGARALAGRLRESCPFAALAAVGR